MDRPTLEDHLRQATRHFSTRLPEDQVFRLGAKLALALVAAHGSSPPRYPEIEPSRITMNGETPDLDGTASLSGPRESLFELGALLAWLAVGERPSVAWRLDPPALPPLSNLLRRTTLARLLSQRADSRFELATDAQTALQRAADGEEAEVAPWPVFRGDDKRSGARSSGTSPRALVPVWDALIGSLIASPVATSTLVIGATSEGRLVFLDRASGRIAHVVPLGAAVESTPALTPRLVVVGTDTGELVAVHRQTGELAFRARLGDMVRSSPLAVDDRIFVGTIEGRDDGALVALSTDGRILWKKKLGSVFSSPALAGERILVGSDDQSLHAVEQDRGRVAWSTPLGSRVRGTPAVSGDRVFVGTFDGRLAAIDGADGRVVWAREIEETLYSSPAVTSDLVVVGCHDGALHGFAKETGEPRFTATTHGPIVASPVAVGTSFVVASTDGGLYVVDSAGGLLGRHPLPGDGAQSSAAVDGDALWVGSPRGIHALRMVP